MLVCGVQYGTFACCYCWGFEFVVLLVVVASCYCFYYYCSGGFVLVVVGGLVLVVEYSWVRGFGKTGAVAAAVAAADVVHHEQTTMRMN